jgi:arginase
VTPAGPPEARGPSGIPIGPACDVAREPRDVALLSVSIDLGAGRRGVDMGPSALRIAGLDAALEALGCRVHEVGTVNAPEPELSDPGESRARFLREITQVTRTSRELLLRAMGEPPGPFPLILGGDHSLSMGTVAAVADHHRARGETIGLIWVDAHTDMNTPESTPSGNIHGMSLSVLTGSGPGELLGVAASRPVVEPEHVCVIGARDIDPPERDQVRASGIRVFTMSEIDERGIAECVDEAVARAGRGAGTAGIHCSFDLDAIDPMVAPGVGTPVPGGIDFREAHLVCEKLARSGELVGFELVELNPVLDLGNRTALLGVGLIESALGKRIL